jgi:hypothetical protein
VVNGFAVASNTLYVAGDFGSVDGTAVSASSVAQWSGTAWNSLGSGLGGGIGFPIADAIAVGSGGLLIGGDFYSAGGKPSYNLARWGAPPTSNSVTNGGFETPGSPPAGWSVVTSAGTPAVTQTSADRRSGSASMQLAAPDDASFIVSQKVAVAGGPRTLEGWIKIPATTDAFTVRIEVQWLDAGSGVLRTDLGRTYTRSTGGWDQTMITKNPPAGATSAVIRINITSLKATLYADDFAFGTGAPGVPQ